MRPRYGMVAVWEDTPGRPVDSYKSGTLRQVTDHLVSLGRDHNITSATIQIMAKPTAPALSGVCGQCAGPGVIAPGQRIPCRDIPACTTRMPGTPCPCITTTKGRTR